MNHAWRTSESVKFWELAGNERKAKKAPNEWIITKKATNLIFIQIDSGKGKV